MWDERSSFSHYWYFSWSSGRSEEEEEEEEEEILTELQDGKQSYFTSGTHCTLLLNRVTESCRFYSPLTDTEYYRLPAAFVILSFRHKEDYVYSGPLQKKKPEAELESNDGCSIITYRTNCLNSSVTIFSPVLWLEAKKADINNNVFQQCYLRLSLFPYHSTAGLLSVFTTDPKKRTWVWFCLSCFSFLTVGTIGFVSRTL